MTAPLRIALAQFDFPVGAVDANAKRILELAAEARDRDHADVIVFPELALSGYPPEDLLFRPAFLAHCEHTLAALARQITGIVAVVGHPQTRDSVVYNAASVLRDGEVSATYRKRELPNYAVFDERRYFQTGSEPCIFEVSGVRVGIVICEDLWFSAPLADSMAAGAQLVLVPNASPYEAGKSAERDALLGRRLAESPVALAYVNVVGGQDDVVFDGASVLADAGGHVHDAAEAFAEHLLVADFDADSGCFKKVLWPDESDESEVSLTWRALVRATADYVRKNGFDRVWVGLSGGIDSALTLVIAVDALGAEKVTAVRLPSRYTADLSNQLATEQADALGVALQSVSIETPFRGFLEALVPAFSGKPADITEENLQSRCRGALLMALSNKFGGLLLSTGNKSEMAVGYATLYGDMCGAFAPLKDVYKSEVFRLAKWRNEQGIGDRASGPGNTGTREFIPQAVIDRPPSAELRDNQADTDSLPPYDVLDDILVRFIDREQSNEDIIAAGYDAATVNRITRLVLVNEFKRRQSAPGPKVTRRAFGRERRYPISSGWR